MKNIIISVLLGMTLMVTSCKYDNFDSPDSMISGTITYEGSPLNVRGAENELELWQDGYELSEKIALYIAQDGTFSTSLFSGEYKLVRLSGAPWKDTPNDTITIQVDGDTKVNVEVTPYFTVDNVSYEMSEDTIYATFTTNQVVADAELKSAYLYLGANYLTNNVNNVMSLYIDTANIEIGQPLTVSIAVPEELTNKDFFFARIGVNSNYSDHYIMSESSKVVL